MNFFDELFAALENDENVDSDLEKAAGTGSPETSAETEARDETGNPDSPGDDGSPIGDVDDDTTVKEVKSESEATDKSGNPGVPGDDGGTADPIGLEGAAFELFGPSKKSFAAVANLHGTALVKKFIETLQSDGIKFNSDKTMLNEIKEEDITDGTADKANISNVNGVSILIEVKNGSTCVVYLVDGKKTGRVANEDRMRKRIAKAMDKANKNKPASESIGLPRFMRDAMEEVTDLSNVPETRVTTDGPDADWVRKSIGIHKNNNLIPIAPEKDARDESGNTGNPGDDGNPVSESGDTKELPENKFEKVSNDDSGNSDGPGSDGNPVSKSGDTKNLPENAFEKVANDKTGNANVPGIDGDPSTSFESFINTCESMMTKHQNDGSIYIPENLTLEQYATILGYGEILDRAMEAKMTAAERRSLRDDQFGLPSKRKYPLHDKEHVSDAIAYFRFCPPEDRDELARNIIKAIRKFHMDVTITKGNPFEKYYPKAKVVSPRKKGTTGATAHA